MFVAIALLAAHAAAAWAQKSPTGKAGKVDAGVSDVKVVENKLAVK